MRGVATACMEPGHRRAWRRGFAAPPISSAASHTAFALVLFAASASVGAGCDHPSSRPRPRSHPTALTASAHPRPPPPTAWPPDVRDLKTTLDHFTTVTACRDGLRGRMPTEVAEAMEDIGYDDLLEDVCNGIAAVRAHDPAACDALSVSMLRKGCRRRVALVAGLPDACPDDPLVGGREPVCLAWAARDPGLCRGASGAGRPLCRAVLANDAKRCNPLTAADRQRCEMAVRRYASSLGETRHASPAATAVPRMHLEATVLGADGRAGAPVEIDRNVLGRGVYVEVHDCRYRVDLADPAGEVPPPAALDDRPPFATLRLDIPASATIPAHLPLGSTGTRITIVLPGVGEADAITGAEGRVSLTKWRPARGAELDAAVDATLVMTPRRVHLTGYVRSFVRDVDPLPATCGGQAGFTGAAAPAAGAGARMISTAPGGSGRWATRLPNRSMRRLTAVLSASRSPSKRRMPTAHARRTSSPTSTVPTPRRCHSSATTTANSARSASSSSRTQRATAIPSSRPVRGTTARTPTARCR